MQNLEKLAIDADLLSVDPSIQNTLDVLVGDYQNHARLNDLGKFLVHKGLSKRLDTRLSMEMMSKNIRTAFIAIQYCYKAIAGAVIKPLNASHVGGFRRSRIGIRRSVRVRVVVTHNYTLHRWYGFKLFNIKYMYYAHPVSSI